MKDMTVGELSALIRAVRGKQVEMNGKSEEFENLSNACVKLELELQRKRGL